MRVPEGIARKVVERAERRAKKAAEGLSAGGTREDAGASTE